MKHLIILVLIIITGVCGWLAGRSSSSSDTHSIGNLILPEKEGEFAFINPTVTAGLGKHYIINVQPLKDAFTKIREKYTQDIYIYFAYLNNDSWVGYNEREYFTAASTIKVPLAMSLMRAVEEGRVSLDDHYVVTREDLNDQFGDFYKTAEGNSYTLRELMKLMLEKSDNTASFALISALKSAGIEDPFQHVYTFMGWDNYPGFGEAPEYFAINLKVLSNMFLALYNAKYVDIEHSEEILRYLDNANFDEQIVSGLPHSVAVAHKTGIQADTETYSDCGIVYVPHRNYLLCIGSEGAPKHVADKLMVEISKAAYEYVVSN